uniref:Si:ch211-160f23.7 n=1 Tax=Gadus morhua TaxID=8049 RepID=A0A8C5C959_GADMO
MEDEDASAAPVCIVDPHPHITPPEAPCASSMSSASTSHQVEDALLTLPPSVSATALLGMVSPATRRSISMGDFRRVSAALLSRSEPPSASATAPSSKLVTPSSSMEFQAARRRLLEVEERQRVIHEMERRLEELRQVFVRSEQEVVVHGEVVSRISGAAQQGELCVTENTQRVKKAGEAGDGVSHCALQCSRPTSEGLYGSNECVPPLLAWLHAHGHGCCFFLFHPPRSPRLGLAPGRLL